MNHSPDRRQLVFSELDAVTRDAESLLATGYDKAGKWERDP